MSFQGVRSLIRTVFGQTATKRQLNVLLAGVIVFVLMGAFPPWRVASGNAITAVGYSPIFYPPHDTRVERSYDPGQEPRSTLEKIRQSRRPVKETKTRYVPSGTQIDHRRLMVQWTVLTVLLAVIIHRLKPRGANGEKSRHGGAKNE